jgi:hypothetical protein
VITLAPNTVVKGDKEFIFNLYLKEHPQILNQALNLELDGILLEQYYEGGLKVDLYSKDKKLGREVLMETWLGQTNGYHQDKIMKLSTALNEGTIVYLATSYQEKHVQQLKEYIQQLGKPIQLYLLLINPEVMVELTELNRLNSLLVYHHLFWLDNVESPLKIKELIQHPYYQDLRPKTIKPTPPFDLTTREGRNRQLLSELRRQIPEFLVFHREKHHIDLLVLNFGGGMAGIGYFLSLADRYEKAFLELRFEQDKADWYQHFARFENYYRKEIGDKLEFHKSTRTIGYYFTPFQDAHDTIAELVKTFHEFLEFFTFYVELGKGMIHREQIIG